MRAFTLLTLGIGVLVGLQPAWALGPAVNSVDRASDLCDIFADGFESGDFSAWSSVIP